MGKWFHNTTTAAGRAKFAAEVKKRFGLKLSFEREVPKIRQEASPKPSVEPPSVTFKVLLTPRWHGGPGICPETLLPAFKDEKQLSSFLAGNCPGYSVRRKGVCRACGHWHCLLYSSGPSGSTAGKVREDLLPKGFVPFMRESTLRAIEQRKMEARERYERGMHQLNSLAEMQRQEQELNYAKERKASSGEKVSANSSWSNSKRPAKRISKSSRR